MFPEGSPLFLEEDIGVDSGQREDDRPGSDAEGPGGHAAEVIERAGLGMSDVKDLAAGSVGPSDEVESPDEILDVTDGHRPAFPAEDRDDAETDDFEVIQEVLIPGPINGSDADDGHGEDILPGQGFELAAAFAEAVDGNGGRRVVFPEGPPLLAGAGRGEAREKDEAGTEIPAGQGFEEVCRALPVYLIIIALAEGLGDPGEMEDDVEIGRQVGDGLEVAAQDADAGRVEIAKLGRVADERGDGHPAMAEELGEMAADKTGPARYQRMPHEGDYSTMPERIRSNGARGSRRILGTWLGLAVAASAAAQVLPIDQVRPGQKGKGRTVFAATNVEEFDVEILGVLANTSAKRSIILARLGGRNLESTGVIQGMSGSPVYVDGKLVGAVAFSFPFSKEPIAGLTPIEEMLAIAESSRSSAPAAPKIAFTDRLSLEDLFAVSKDRLEIPSATPADGRMASPLPLPLSFGGFSARVVDRARPFFSALGFRPLVVPGGAQNLPKTPSPDFTVRGGDPLALQLVSGDLDVSAVGTATYVDGSKVYAFGHPLYNLGAVDYGMAKASVITVVPALESSFKMASAGSLIGAFVQDRTSGALGEIGRMPKFVPLNLNLVGEDGKRREFKLKIVNDRLLTPLLTNMSLAQILGTEDRSLGDLTLELSGDVTLDTNPAQGVHLEDVFTGNLDVPVTEMSGLVTAVLYFLTNNEFQEVGIHRLDLNVRSIEGPRVAVLERVWLDKYDVSPGESVQMKVYTRSFRGTTEVQEIPFLAPHLPPGAEFQLVVADTASMQRVEAGQYRSQGIVPRSFAQLVRLLNNLRKNNRIYFKLVGPRPGLFLRGEEMPNLPPAMKSLFASPRAASSQPTEISVSTLAEYQLPVPYAFRGLAVIPLRIRK